MAKQLEKMNKKELIPEKVVLDICNEFKINTQKIFGENLLFAFIFGGFAKGYATKEHDIDMFICLNIRHPEQEKNFRDFYFIIHHRYELTCDYKDPGEITSYAELERSLALLEHIEIKPVIKTYREYESIVWGDIFSGQIIAEIGDIKCLTNIRNSCSKYSEKWKKEILSLIDKETLKSEWENIKLLNTTRLFRRFITYLKLEENYVPMKMHVCILGGGGNVAEAIAANLSANGHKVSQFRFSEQIRIPGIPMRPLRSKERLNETKFLNVSNQQCKLQVVQVRWITEEQFVDVDVFIFAFPSYMAEIVGERLGNKIAGKPLINLSDRFLGTYALMRAAYRTHGLSALPNTAVCFNGVPIMALKANRDAPTSIYYVKPKHSIAWYPQTREGRTCAYKLLLDLFNFEQDKLVSYPSMLHLAFENAHCVEHAVVDLANLKNDRYEVNGGGFLYSTKFYDEDSIIRISDIIEERDKVSARVLGRRFASLKDYDLRVFGNGGNPDLGLAGTQTFRTQHGSLSKAPSLTKSTAFGYEDVGWSLVTLESFGKLFDIATPKITSLIDEWNEFMHCNYRSFGRTANSLALASAEAVATNYKSLDWLDCVTPQRIQPLTFDCTPVSKF